MNTYGTPAFKEVNPALFTIATFPFLFGVMFGDVMHGTMLFVIASILCFVDRKPGTVAGGLGKIRYLLLLMGFFSTFCGFIYNDFSSIPLETFGKSCYKKPEVVEKGAIPVRDADCMYPIGVDPMWYRSVNELTFMNSLKMKIAVILGVLQMSLGVCMKAFNAAYFDRRVELVFEFIPQIVMLLALFGFMDMIIIIKWLTDWHSLEHAKPPSIISMMISMMLNFGKSETGETELMPYQIPIMNFLLAIVLICVPLMLFVKPVYESIVAKRHHHGNAQIVQDGQQVYTAINEGGGEYENDRKLREHGAPASNDLNDFLSPNSKSERDNYASQHGFGELFIH